MVGACHGSATRRCTKAAVERAVEASRNEGRPLQSADLPAEAELSALAPDRRRELCRRLLADAGRMPAPAPGDAAPGFVPLVRGRLGGERCLDVQRRRACRRGALCPFRHDGEPSSSPPQGLATHDMAIAS